MISATDEGDLETVFGLAKLLKKEAKLAAAAAAVEGAVLKRVAGSKDTNTSKNLDDFLGMATAMKDVPLALEILKKMARTNVRWHIVRRDAVLAALRAFEWNALQDAVQGWVLWSSLSNLNRIWPTRVSNVCLKMLRI